MLFDVDVDFKVVNVDVNDTFGVAVNKALAVDHAFLGVGVNNYDGIYGTVFDIVDVID